MGSPKRTLVPVVGQKINEKMKKEAGGGGGGGGGGEKRKQKKKREKKGIRIPAPAPTQIRSRWCAFGLWTLEIFEPEVLERAAVCEPEQVS